MFVCRLTVNFLQLKIQAIIQIYVRVQYRIIKYEYSTVSTNPTQVGVYSIQHYVIKVVSDVRHVGGFLRVLRFPQQ